MKKIINLILVLAFLSTAKIKAQVTIGKDSVAHPGAILDLKLADGDGKGKGLLFPKVELGSIDEYFVTLSDTEDATGTAVYNTNPSVGTGKGLYVWDGKENQWLFTVPATGDVDPSLPYATIDYGNDFDYGEYAALLANVGVWMVENSHEGNPVNKQYGIGTGNVQPEGLLGYYYTRDELSTACPSGFRLPTQADWELLTAAIFVGVVTGVFMEEDEAILPWTAPNQAGVYMKISDEFKEAAGEEAAADLKDWNFWGEQTCYFSEGGVLKTYPNFGFVTNEEFLPLMEEQGVQEYALPVRCIKIQE